MTLTAVVFDLGGVLVDWKPELAFPEARGGPHAFMERIDFRARNLRADKGETFSELATELDDPEDAALLAAYPQRFAATVQGAVPGTWDVLDRLIARGVALHAITNWSAETFPIGVARHPRLGQVFGVTIVSGNEGILKPQAAIYHLLASRAGLDPAACVFIDDALHNVAGAIAAGMDGIHFTGASALAAALTERGLL